MDNRKIGVFDSGLGGLTVVRAFRDILPKESLVYFGDTLHVPYGNRPKAEITAFSMRIAEFLLEHDVKAIVVACNVVSAVCVDKLRAAFDLPILDVLTPGTVEAALASRNAVGVIATYNTIKSGMHARIIKEHNPGLTVYAKACPLFVPIVEEGLHDTEVAFAAARHYLAEFSEYPIDTLLLGCTHYPLLDKAISATVSAPLTDPAAAVVRGLKSQLTAMDALSGGSAEHEFFTSGDPQRFDALGHKALGFTPGCRRALSSTPPID